MKDRESSQDRTSILAEEKRRVEQLGREHKVAMDAAKPDAAPPTVPTQATDLGDRNPYDQKPIAPGAVSGRPVAGRKMMADGKVVESNKANGDDGVAKVGNVGPQTTHHTAPGESEEDKEKREIEATLNDILRKGPIIIFSKSYCPYSKKAKVSRSKDCVQVKAMTNSKCSAYYLISTPSHHRHTWWNSISIRSATACNPRLAP